MDKFDAIIDDLKNNRQPQICNCYRVTKETHYLSDFEKGYYAAEGIFKDREELEVAKCFGTKECKPCVCRGDMRKCDFYENVRKKAEASCIKGKRAHMKKLDADNGYKEYCEIMDNSNFYIDSANEYDIKIKDILETRLVGKKPIRANRAIKESGRFCMLDENEYWKCPNNHGAYDVPLKENQKFCHECGQLIDWSK